MASKHLSTNRRGEYIHSKYFSTYKKGLMSEYLEDLIIKTAGYNNDFAVLCIGTDAITGDSLGPFVGTLLSAKSRFTIPVLGTLHSPVHAINFKSVVDRNELDNKSIIAIDAAITPDKNRIGTIKCSNQPIVPGSGYTRSKKLPSIGDISISGFVCIAPRYMTLKNIGAALMSTRLNTIWTMANYITTELYNTTKKLGMI